MRKKVHLDDVGLGCSEASNNRRGTPGAHPQVNQSTGQRRHVHPKFAADPNRSRPKVSWTLRRQVWILLQATNGKKKCSRETIKARLSAGLIGDIPESPIHCVVIVAEVVPQLVGQRQTASARMERPIHDGDPTMRQLNHGSVRLTGGESQGEGGQPEALDQLAEFTGGPIA